MTKQNLKLIAILKLARDKYLWNGNASTEAGRQKFICFAIKRANDELYGDYDMPVRLEKLVDQHLHNHCTMVGFLHNSSGLSQAKLSGMTNKKYQTYRFMLTNHMIRLLGGEV